MPDNQNSIDLSRRLLPGFIPYWRHRLCLSGLTAAGRPHSARFHLIRGRILLSIGQYDQAASDFRHALRLDWRDEQAILWLNKAKRAMQRAVDQTPRAQL
ncbi:tetratricopeptide repeat protein [Microvirga makkahensis]|uniref:Tetratricopeptide repeat protein n=1 Tax=Microvirga makkahensis TaxID=1128670 RepID=A0A7X3SPU1_9HYPH|nr:tetratricopeptide repeat protein [Microvirga makkahensis]MXQ12827.1 hypothetical protein [Microvirga makkahensis]